MIRNRKCLGLVALLMVHASYAYCENHSQTIQFNDNQAYTYNYAWKHSLDQFPVGSSIKSASLELRVQVWYWGMNIYEQNIDIMASDTTSFALPQDRVCELNPSSNPNPSNFYTVTCPLPSSVFASIENDGEIYIGTNTYSGTYYLDYSKLFVNSDIVEKYSLTVNVYPSGSGNVTLNPSSQTYNSGHIVTLSAVNNAGYIFDHWVGDVSNTLQTTTTVTMSKTQSVEAYFSSDRDQDGVKDSIDGCPDDPKNIEPSQCGCGCANANSGENTMPWLYLLIGDK